MTILTELAHMHQGELRDLAKSLGVKVGRMTREQMAAAIVEHRVSGRVATKHGRAHVDDDSPCMEPAWCQRPHYRTPELPRPVSPPVAARRRILATIATECPGQDVAGATVIDDALRIDFVSGCALLVGADGTLSWEAAAVEEPCTDCDGRGHYNIWPHTTCPQCGGSGRESRP